MRIQLKGRGGLAADEELLARVEKKLEKVAKQVSPLAECKIELELAALMLRKAAALYDAGFKGAGEASNMAKYAAAEAAIRCVDQAIQTHGGNGVAEEYGLSDMWWGVRTMRIAPVSREMILNYVAEHSLGLPRSY